MIVYLDISVVEFAPVCKGDSTWTEVSTEVSHYDDGAEGVSVIQRVHLDPLEGQPTDRVETTASEPLATVDVLATR